MIKKFLIIKNRCTHEDWKTVAVRPETYPYLEKGTKVEFIKQISNYYGIFIEVKSPVGTIYDLDPRNIEEGEAPNDN